MSVIEKVIKISRTKTGTPCLWESTSVFDNLSRATIITTASGDKKEAIELNVYKEKQAKIPIDVNDLIVKAFKDQHGIAYSIFTITDISAMDNTAKIIPIYRKSSLVEETVPKDYEYLLNLCLKKLEENTFVYSYISE